MSSDLKAVIFDLDGTLIDATEWHFRALNQALGIFGESISRLEHETSFNGLPTRVKLERLSNEGRLPKHLFKLVGAIKQDRTLREISSLCFPRVEHLLMLSWLKARGLKLGVATNSIRETAETMLSSGRIRAFFDVVVTNEDVSQAKPHPESYLKACRLLGVAPNEALVVEDHDYGVAAAIAAGCNVLKVEGPASLTTRTFDNYFQVSSLGLEE